MSERKTTGRPSGGMRAARPKRPSSWSGSLRPRTWISRLIAPVEPEPTGITASSRGRADVCADLPERSLVEIRHPAGREVALRVRVRHEREDALVQLVLDVRVEAARGDEVEVAEGHVAGRAREDGAGADHAAAEAGEERGLLGGRGGDDGTARRDGRRVDETGRHGGGVAQRRPPRRGRPRIASAFCLASRSTPSQTIEQILEERRVGDPVHGARAVLAPVHERRPVQDREMLAHVRLRAADLFEDLADGRLAPEEPPQDLETHRLRERPETHRDLVAAGVRQRKVRVDRHMAIIGPRTGRVNDADGGGGRGTGGGPFGQPRAPTPRGAPPPWPRGGRRRAGGGPRGCRRGRARRRPRPCPGTARRASGRAG